MIKKMSSKEKNRKFELNMTEEELKGIEEGMKEFRKTFKFVFRGLANRN